MTKLIVTPIDMAARGSYRERQKLLRAYAALQESQKATDISAMAAAFDAFEVLIAAHAQTDDGSTVAEALEMASANDFDLLLGALLGRGETIPPVNSVS
jgi:ABC-type branched-subunit amino acid transport system substrate-binding protein